MANQWSILALSSSTFKLDKLFSNMANIRRGKLRYTEGLMPEICSSVAGLISNFGLKISGKIIPYSKFRSCDINVTEGRLRNRGSGSALSYDAYSHG